MRSLSLLVVLFVVVVRSATSASSSATRTLIKELVANGTRQTLSSFNSLYLTEDIASDNPWALPGQYYTYFQAWTIVQINDHEVAIRSNRGNYIAHGHSDWAKQSEILGEWEMLTPVKNADGTWSFKSRANKWLSAQSYYGPERYSISFEPENKRCEHWYLLPFLPPRNPLMDELLANGGRWRLKSHNETYLTDDGRGFLDADPWVVLSDQNRGVAQVWTIIQMGENEVVLESSSRYYLEDGLVPADMARLAYPPKDLEMLTPVKNADGAWSFKSRQNKWLSSANFYPYFMPENGECEHWRLELP